MIKFGIKKIHVYVRTEDMFSTEDHEISFEMLGCSSRPRKYTYSEINKNVS